MSISAAPVVEQPRRMPSLDVRRMLLSDLDRIVFLEKESFPDPWSEQNFTYEIVENQFSQPYVVTSDGHVIAYSVHWCFDIEAHLANFAVDQAYRRQNVGSYLLGFLISDILRRDIHSIYLEIRASNDAARNLYKKHGFREDGVRKHYYLKEKDDAILMSLILKEA